MVLLADLVYKLLRYENLTNCTYYTHGYAFCAARPFGYTFFRASDEVISTYS
jgi:hypothetical protein